MTHRFWDHTLQLLRNLHDDEDAVATTEYLIVFVLFAVIATLGIIASAVYVKGYRDFLVWWMANPAV